MKYDAEPDPCDRLATFDIETTHYDPTKGETVAIGVGSHPYGNPASEAEYQTFVRESDDDEAELVTEAFEAIDAIDPDALVSYNGIGFDMDFLSKRSANFDVEVSTPEVHIRGPHVDVFADRKAACGPNDKWPSLEECLKAYGYPVPKTIWNGAPVDNTRFGEELGPEWLRAVAAGDSVAVAGLRDVLDHYLITDLEANLAIYYADRGISFVPNRLGSEQSFDTL
jgi:hypothetical protein